KQGRRHFLLGSRAFTLIQQVNRFARPARPMTQQSACNVQQYFAARSPDGKFCEEIGDNIIVITSIEGYLLGATCFRHCPYDLQRLITIEGSNLDRDYIWDLHKTLPEL